jgi:DNA/RNA-binding domain of Phe-tRNA-synthetase-like protein
VRLHGTPAAETTTSAEQSTMADPFTIDPALVDLFRLGVATCEVGRVLDADPALDEPLAAAAARLRESTALDVAPARAMYRSIGIDPTKVRPSSEALLRRIRKGDGLPRVNTAVDICNWCSVEAQLPYGLYDADQVVGAVALRRGRPGESYAGIRKDDVHLEGRLLLSDEQGPFGNPTSDSARTMVTTSTRRLLVVVFAPRTFGADALGRVLGETIDRYSRYADGKEIARWMT